MIIAGLIVFCIGIISWIISILPSAKIDFAPESQGSFIEVLNSVSCIVPVNTMGIILGIILLVYGVEFAWYCINWIIAKIPFIE